MLPCYDAVMASALQSRACTWEDIPSLHELNARVSRAAAQGANAHIGEFYWALRSTVEGDPLSGMRVWPDTGGSLSAAAWLDPPHSSDLLVAPDADERLLDNAMDWLESEACACGGEALSIVVNCEDERRIDALRRRGYTRSAAGNVRFRHKLDPIPASKLPAGFSLGHVSTDSDVDARVFVEMTAFGGTTLNADLWRLLAHRLADYQPTLDLLVGAADGTGASACTCWYDERSRRGEIEAVGTSTTFRRMGLGKAVVSEGLRRLSELGASEAVLYSNIGNAASMALYKSCGFEVVGEDFAWVRRLE